MKWDLAKIAVLLVIGGILGFNIGVHPRPDDDVNLDSSGIVFVTNTTVIWPEVFTDPNFQYTGEHITERAIADGLMGWANCRMDLRPEQFGWGMLEIDKVLGILPTEDNLMKLAKERKKE